MAPLSTVLDNYCLQSKDKLEVASCELYHQKKKLDLTTPVRFANLPKDAKLELVTGLSCKQACLPVRQVHVLWAQNMSSKHSSIQACMLLQALLLKLDTIYIMIELQSNTKGMAKTCI